MFKLRFRKEQSDYPVHGVATRDCDFFPVFYFSCFALGKVSLIGTFVIAFGVVFCKPFFICFFFL